MAGPGSVAVPYVRGLLELARAAGVETDGVLAEIGIDEESDPDSRISLERYHAFWDALERRSGDPDLGLHMAEQNRPGTFSALDYVVRNCRTLSDAFACLSRYSRILHSGVDIIFRPEGEVVRVLHYPPHENPRQSTEWSLGTWVVVGSQILEEPLTPISVSFRHPAPKSLVEHERVLGAPVTFGAGVTEMLFDRSVLSRRVGEADPRLHQLLERYALRPLLEQVPREQSVVDRARAIISKAFAGAGDARLESVASGLGMSSRTLQRYLKREGIESYQSLVDQTRRDLAVQYLRDSPIAISEAAFLLGFSDPSAFYRAFKRWTGRTPKQFREQAALA